MSHCVTPELSNLLSQCGVLDLYRGFLLNDSLRSAHSVGGWLVIVPYGAVMCHRMTGLRCSLLGYLEQSLEQLCVEGLQCMLRAVCLCYSVLAKSRALSVSIRYFGRRSELPSAVSAVAAAVQR